MRGRRLTPILVSGVIERADNHVLVALAHGQPEGARVWHFPRGFAEDGESPEAAMRRVASSQFGLMIEIVVGQPPFLAPVDGRETQVRYFFCGIVSEEAAATGAEQVCWIPRMHLLEYDFDALSEPVARYLLEERGR